MQLVIYFLFLSSGCFESFPIIKNLVTFPDSSSTFDCNISKNVYIDHDVIIGNNVKIQNGVSVYNGVTLEDDIFLGPSSTFTNDLLPRSRSENWQVIPTLVKKGVSVGANATILCGVILGEYSMIGAGAVVISNTLPHSLMVGNPAR